MKIIVVSHVFISEWERPIWPPYTQIEGNRQDMLSFNLMDYLAYTKYPLDYNVSP